MPPPTGQHVRLETVHLVRHAHAGDPEAWDAPDELRPLSAKGRRQAERLGAFLVLADIRPDSLISSAKIRALQTAELVGQALGRKVEVDERLSGGCSLASLDALLGDSNAHAPMIFGHDPDFSVLVADLLGTSGFVMRKGALASIDVQRPLRVGAGVLRWLIPPEVLADQGS